MSSSERRMFTVRWMVKLLQTKIWWLGRSNGLSCSRKYSFFPHVSQVSDVLHHFGLILWWRKCHTVTPAKESRERATIVSGQNGHKRARSRYVLWQLIAGAS